jgi:hypothetical protein
VSRYGAGASRAGINTADSVYFQLRATTAAQRIKVLEVVVGVAVAPTTAPSFYLTRSSAVGTSTATLAGQPLDPADPTPGIGTFDSTWSAAPTITAANKIQVGALAVTAGGAWVWSFRDWPLVMAAATTSGLCVVNASASGATLGTFVCSYLWQE